MALEIDGRSAAPSLPETPDFDVYPIDATIENASACGDHVRIIWSDGRTSRYHAVWLRNNCGDDGTVNPKTREQTIDIADLPDDFAAAAAGVDNSGALSVRWSPAGDISRFHPGWLRAHDYSNGARADPADIAPELWQAADLGQPPTFDGNAVFTDPSIRAQWLTALARHGIARLRAVAPRPGKVEEVAHLIGTIRDSNFGHIFDVKAVTTPNSNANTALELPQHVDLPTREYQPGLQLLHCLKNTTSGGRAVMVDGYKVAEDIRRDDAIAFRTLTRTEWTFTNRAADSDYRWRTPMIVLDPTDRCRELRINGFLIGPLDLPFDEVTEAYRAYRALSARIRQPRYRMRFDYRPGDLVAFDNRRILHAREAFDEGIGERWLQGCYMEREELASAIRILARRRRQARMTG